MDCRVKPGNDGDGIEGCSAKKSRAGSAGARHWHVVNS